MTPTQPDLRISLFLSAMRPLWLKDYFLKFPAFPLMREETIELMFRLTMPALVQDDKNSLRSIRTDDKHPLSLSMTIRQTISMGILPVPALVAELTVLIH